MEPNVKELMLTWFGHLMRLPEDTMYLLSTETSFQFFPGGGDLDQVPGGGAKYEKIYFVDKNTKIPIFQIQGRGKCHPQMTSVNSCRCPFMYA